MYYDLPFIIVCQKVSKTPENRRFYVSLLHSFSDHPQFTYHNAPQASKIKVSQTH
jgi:hypothetical protein